MTEATLAAGNVLAGDNGAMDFIANATGAIFAEGWTPELQKMVGGRQDAAGHARGRAGGVREGAVALSSRAQR